MAKKGKTGNKPNVNNFRDWEQQLTKDELRVGENLVANGGLTHAARQALIEKLAKTISTAKGITLIAEKEIMFVLTMDIDFLQKKRELRFLERVYLEGFKRTVDFKKMGITEADVIRNFKEMEAKIILKLRLRGRKGAKKTVKKKKKSARPPRRKGPK